MKLTVAIIKAYHCCQLHTKFYPTFFSLRQTPYGDEITGDRHCGFLCNRSITDDIFYVSDIGEKWEYIGRVHQLFIDFESL
jgi:hypothetical protein